MILLNRKKNLFSSIKYSLNGFILKILPSKRKKAFLQYLRIKKDDDIYKSLLDEHVLTKEQHQIINDFWSKYYNIRHISHEFYTQKTGRFFAEYIPDSLWRRVIDPFYNDWKLAHYIDNKCYYNRIFSNQKLGVNLPYQIAYRLNGIWYNAEDRVVPLEQIVSDVMRSKDCFIKVAVESWGGFGVKYFRPSQNNEIKLMTILTDSLCDLVIQEGVKQSSELSKINSDSINTLRVLSMLKLDGSVKIYSIILRMGVNGSKIDNASSGGISIGVRPDGTLNKVAYSNTGVSYKEHPTSHVSFDTVRIPNIQEVKSLVNSLHPQFPHFRLIGWDIAINEANKPVLIEANFCDSELDFLQLNNGPVFGDDTVEVLNEVFSLK